MYVCPATAIASSGFQACARAPLEIRELVPIKQMRSLIADEVDDIRRANNRMLICMIMKPVFLVAMPPTQTCICHAACKAQMHER
jgi:hypothetical protein